jgi:hypothetical protein
VTPRCGVAITKYLHATEIAWCTSIHEVTYWLVLDLAVQQSASRMYSDL